MLGCFGISWQQFIFAYVDRFYEPLHNERSLRHTQKDLVNMLIAKIIHFCTFKDAKLGNCCWRNYGKGRLIRYRSQTYAKAFIRGLIIAATLLDWMAYAA